MKINKLNDWLKVLLVHLGGCILGLILFFSASLIKGWNMHSLLFGNFILTLYYFFAGYFLKNVNVDKVLFVLAIPIIFADLLQQGFPSFGEISSFNGIKILLILLGYIVLGGVMNFGALNVFLPDLYGNETYIIMLTVLTPFLLTFFGMMVSRMSQRSMQKELHKEEFNSLDTAKSKGINDWVKVLITFLGGNVLTLILLGIGPLFTFEQEFAWRVTIAVIGLIYFCFMGVYLRKVKIYKVLVIFIGAFLINRLASPIQVEQLRWIIKACIADGGSAIYGHIWTYFTVMNEMLNSDGVIASKEKFDYLVYLSMQLPLITICASMIISKISAKSTKEEVISSEEKNIKEA